MLGLGAVDDTLAMMSQVCFTCARVGVGWTVGVPRAWVGAVETAGAGEGRNVGGPCRLVPVVPAWRSCVGTHLSRAMCLILCWGSRGSLSDWTCKIETEDAIVLMLSRIWSI